MSTPAGTIGFSCPRCGRPFTVPTSYAGRKASCKTCGGKVVVPSVEQPASIEDSPLDDAPPVPRPDNAIHAVTSGRMSPEELKQQILSDEAIPTPAAPLPRAARAPLASEAQSPHATIAAPSTPLAISVSDTAPIVPGDDLAPAVPDIAPSKTEAAPAISEPVLERPAPSPHPHQIDVPATKPTTPRLPVRIRRLMADADQMTGAFTDFSPIRIKSIVGDPPEIYQIEYKIAGLQRGRRKKPKAQNTHLVEIRLTSDYPRLAPQCRMLTPVFHPNIDETTICVGDHWTAGERLVDLVVRIGEMLAYQAYNIKSPLDGEAAMWADLNPDRLPTDPQNLRPSDPA